MSTAPRPTTANKQAASKKLMTLLKKRYKTPLPHDDRPVLETILHAVCLEDSTDAEAEETLTRLKSLFHDLNEVRVSSISELAVAFDGIPQAERKALRIRSTLQFVFEKNYAFDCESLRKKTLDLAVKQLAKIKELSPFVRSYTLNSALGAHLIPIDESMVSAAVWLGLLPLNATVEQASAELKSVIRKNEAQQFCHMLRCLARDPLLTKTFERARAKPPADGFSLGDASRRLEELFSSAAKLARSTKKRPEGAKSGATAKVVKRAKTASSAGKKTSSSAAGRLVAKKAAAKKTGGSHIVRKKK